MKKVFLFVMLFIFSGCSLFKNKANSSYEYQMSAQEKQKHEDQLVEASLALEEQKFVTAEDLFAKYITENNYSIFTLHAKLGQARALSGQGRWVEALNLLRDLKEESLKNHPDVFALSAYYSSFAYEALAYDEKIYTSLMDAKKYSDYLPKEISQAEIPARLAVYFYKKNEFDESKKYFREAEKAVSILFADSKLKTKKARSYFMMGQVSTNQIGIENLISQINSLSLLQVFTLKSIESNDAIWSKKALENLKINYRDVWNSIVDIPKNNSMDSVAADQEQKEAKIKALGEVLKNIQQLKLYQHPNQENSYLSELNSFIEQVENQAQEYLLSLNSLTPLTPEALQYKKLKLNMTIQVEPFFQNEKKSVLKNEDPNLQGN